MGEGAKQQFRTGEDLTITAKLEFYNNFLRLGEIELRLFELSLISLFAGEHL
jgi:hypothetical protein